MSITNALPTMVVADNVRAEMARRHVSQSDLGSHLRISQNAVSKRLRGVVPFDVNELAAAAKFLGVPVSALMPEQVAS